MKLQRPEIIGIINITPDSFSDGGKSFSQKDAIDAGLRLLDEGADILDIGGDSTRPGSQCVGAIEEWKRIAKAVSVLSKKARVSVDTHFSETARLALSSGAAIINDISGGQEEEMLRTVCEFKAKVVLMYLPSGTPHLFPTIESDNILQQVSISLKNSLNRALAVGLTPEQIILDTGMGAFLSPDPDDSWKVITNYHRFTNLGAKLLLGASRKGFLSGPNKLKPQERDASSLIAALTAWENAGFNGPHYLRVHNVALHLKAFQLF